MNSPLPARRRRASEDDELEAVWRRRRDGGGGVALEGHVDGEGAGRTKSLTDDDLEELQGCLDLGFCFSYDEIPELCATLPALELCYSLSHHLLDDRHHGHKSSTPETEAASPPPIANWKISSPGDDPEEVKARLKYWAQAVACTVRLCS